MSTVAQGNVGAAFGVAFGAGLSTTIGAAVPFFRKVKSSDKKLLAGALALSGGVMLFVSFCEILQVKSVEAFAVSRALRQGCSEDDGLDWFDCLDSQGGYAITSAYATFFAGVILTKLLEMLVHRLTGESDDDVLDEMFAEAEAVEKGHELKTSISAVPHGNRASRNSSTSVEESVESGAGQAAAIADENEDEGSLSLSQEATSDSDEEADDQSGTSGEVTKGEHGPLEIESPQQSARDKALQRMSLLAGLALALHNFPEGLATFAATLTDVGVGASLGVAIAIHNIPEGVVVAMPVYYATGSKWKAFFWATMSGVAEPVGALLGYAVLVTVFDDVIYGILFALVAGMMVYIVIGELLPTALKYDTKGKIVIPAFFIGQFIMALSLVAFQV